MTRQAVHSWALRLLAIIGTAGAVALMHSSPVDPSDLFGARPDVVVGAGQQGGAGAPPAAEPMNGRPQRPDSGHHAAEHLCLAILTAFAAWLILLTARRPSPAPGVPAPMCFARTQRAPPPAGRYLLMRLCVLRV